jgi:stearoyl-CoA desaturase (delta-9 desaturase)
MTTAAQTTEPVHAASKARYFDYVSAIRFIIFHAAAIAGSIYVGVTKEALICAVVLYYARMFGVSAGLHRYFAHRTYKTSRVMQFLLAALGVSAAQRGVLWWAGNHRLHHRYADTDRDLHSPLTRGFWHAHMGWLFENDGKSDHALMHDFAKYPELVWLDEHWLVPPALLGIVVFLTLGWSGLFFGFGVGTIALWHGTFTVNSIAHLVGSKRFKTSDDSRNSPLLIPVTLGECWHNNHHHFMGSARQGFYWWEIDVSYYVLRLLALVGLVWDIKEPPAKVYLHAG